jgi:hypothetical protein
MANLTISRKQRLRTLENEIRSGMEEFYYVGMKLKEIRDQELYKEDGFPSGDAGWLAYCKERWEWAKSYANKLIRASEYRDKIPSGTTGTQEWSERSVRELTRIEDKREAARVAAKVVKAVEQSEREAAKDPEVKPLRLTAATVRKFVDEDLGVDRAAQARATKRRREEEGKPELHRFLIDMAGRIEAEKELLLEEVPEDGWKLLVEKHPGVVKRLTAACESLADLLRKVQP